MPVPAPPPEAPSAGPPPPAGYAPPPGYGPPAPYYYPPPPYYPYPPPPTYPGVQPARPSREAGAETHDGGYLRLQFGLNTTKMKASSPSGEWVFDGEGASFGIAVGGAVVPNLIVYLEFLIAGAAEPTVEQNSDSITNLRVGGSDVYGVGPGIAYYFDPVNVFLAATILYGRARITDTTTENNLFETKSGRVFELLLGKEWWVSDNWGLGASVQAILATLQGKAPIQAGELVPEWKVSSFSLLFSATYN
jgi:hypothetical protein